MPARARSSAPTQTTPTQSGESSLPHIGESQEELRDVLKDGGSAEGLSNYRGTLGQWLGTELYTALASELTFDKLVGHATSAWEDALKSAVDELDKLDGQGGDKSLDPFRKAVKEQFGGIAAELMDSDLGHAVVSKLNGWVDAHPKTIVTVALLAAAGAVAANVSLPELQQKLELGSGFTAKVGMDLGRIREIALKEIKAELEYASGPLVAAASVARDEDGEVSYGLSGKLGDDSKYIKADGKFTEDGLDVYGIHGLYKTDDDATYQGSITKQTDKDPQIAASITTKDGDTTRIQSAKYDTGSGVLTLTDTQIGKLSGALGYKRELGMDSEGTAHAGGSLTYTDGDLKATAGGQIKTDGSGHVSGTIQDKFAEGLSGSARLRHDFGGTERTRAGLDLTYRGSEWAGRAGYSYDSKDGTHKADGLVQRDFGDGWKARAEGSITASDLGTSYEAGGSVYKKLNSDVAVFGGGSYRQDQLGGRFVPKAGLEVKGVPVEWSYDAATKQHKVAVTVFKW